MENDPMNKLDVLCEADKRASATKKAANDMMVAVAIEAILAGADIKQVAQKCGFDLGGSKTPEVEMQFEGAGGLFASLMVPAWAMGGTSSQLEAFVSWLLKGLREIVHQRLNGEIGL